MQNIKKGIIQVQKYKDAQDYSKKLQGIARATNWYQTKQKFQKLNQMKLAQKKMNQQLKFGRQELVIRRRDRLARLYKQENDMYQQQLAQKGLAIYKVRL